MNWTTREPTPFGGESKFCPPTYRKVRVRLLRPLHFGGQRKEAGGIVEVIEPDAAVSSAG